MKGKQMERNHKYIECDCDSPEHVLRFTWDNDPNWPYLEIGVFLNCYLRFWKRLLYGIKYILGFRNKYVAYDDTLLTYQKVEELHYFLYDWLVRNKKHSTSPITVDLTGKETK